jgi:hypothetical protein
MSGYRYMQESVERQVQAVLESLSSRQIDDILNNLTGAARYLWRAFSRAIDIADAAPEATKKLFQKAEGSTRERLCELILASASCVEDLQARYKWLSEQVATAYPVENNNAPGQNKGNGTPGQPEGNEAAGCGTDDEWVELEREKANVPPYKGARKVAQEAINTRAEEQEPEWEVL